MERRDRGLWKSKEICRGLSQEQKIIDRLDGEEATS